MQSVVIDLNRLLLDELSALRSLVGDRVHVAVSMTTHVAAIRVEPPSLRRAILGLARNAADAMPNGGTLFIETQNFHIPSEQDCGTKLPLGEYVCLSICDTGTTLEWGSSLPRACAMALRLAPVYAFAKQNGGTATVGSDAVTKISIYLPRASAAPSSIPIKDETDELRLDLLRRRWQGISHATPSASLAEDLASPGQVAGRWFSPRASAHLFSEYRAPQTDGERADDGSRAVTTAEFYR